MASAHAKNVGGPSPWVLVLAYRDRHGIRRQVRFGEGGKARRYGSKRRALQDKAEATKRAKALEAEEWTRAGHKPRGRLTVGDVVDHYLSGKRGTRKTVMSAKVYTGHLKSIRGVWLDELTHVDVERVLSRCDKTMKPASVNEVRKHLGAAIREAWRSGRWDGANVVEKTRMRTVSKREVDVLTAAEVTELVAKAASRSRAFIAVAVYQGLRLGEQCALTHEDLDRERWTLRVSKSWGRKTTKSGSYRVIPVLAPAREHLEEAAKNGTPWLFPGPEGFQRSEVYHPGPMLRRNLKRAKIDKTLRWHDLRHTCATLLARQGFDVRTVAWFLGHSSTDVTERIYTHASAVWLSDRMAGAFEGDGHA